MAENPDPIDAALNALSDALNDPAPDYTWATGLPEAPPMPVAADDTIAIAVPKGGKP